MADNFKLTAEYDADVSGLVGGIKEAKSAVSDIEKEIIDAFGGMEGVIDGLGDTAKSVGDVLDDSFSKGVSSIADTTGEVTDLQGVVEDLGNTKIHVDGLDDMSKTIMDAKGSVDRFDSSLQGINGSDVKGVGSDFNKTGSDAKGAEGDVDRFDSSLKGVGSGSELKEVQSDIEGIADEADNAVGALEGMAGAIGGMVGLGGIEDAIQLGIDEARLAYDIESALNAGLKGGQRVNIDVAMDMAGEEYATLSAIMGEDEATEIIRTISVHADTDDAEEVVRLVDEVGSLASNTAIKFELDATEVIEEAVKLSKSLGITQQEAIALQDHLLSVGLPPGEIDIITEYGQQLHRAGYDAEEIQAIMASGLDTGTWNIDILMDGLKEGRILMAEFGQGLDDATIELVDKVGISEKQMVNWGKAVAEGGEEGATALMEATKALAEVEDATLQNELGVKMFGTMWEEVGTDITDTMGNMGDHAVTLEEGVARISEETDNLEDEPWVRIDVAMTTIQGTLGEMLAPIVELVAQVATWASENETLVKVIMLVLGALTLVITVLGVLAGVLGLVAIASMTAFGVPLIILALVIVAIGAVIAAIIIFWDEIVEYATWAFDNLKELVGAVVDWFLEKWDEGIENLKELWETVVEWFTAYQEFMQELWESIVGFFIDKWDEGVANVTAIWETIVAWFTAYQEFMQGLWESIIGFFVNIWETTVEWFKNKWNSIKETFNNLKTFITDIWETIKNTVREKVGALVDKAVELFTSLYDKVKEKVDNIKTAVGDAIQGAFDTVTGWFGKFKEAGGNIIGNIIDGIKGMAGRLKDTASSALSSVRDMLPFSPPKDKSSPLAGIEDNGIIEQIIKGIRSQEGELDNAMRGLLSGYDTTASIGMDASVLEDEFASIGYGLESTVNGSINSMVNVRTKDNDIPQNKQPANIYVKVFDEYDKVDFIEDINDYNERKTRRGRGI